MNPWSSRKIRSAWALTLLSSGLVAFGTISDVVWGSFMGVLWTTYFAANHMDKRVQK